MNSRTIFSCATRIIGLIVLLDGCRDILEAVILGAGFVEPAPGTIDPEYFLLWSFAEIPIGLWLMRGAAPLERFAFDKRPFEEDDSKADDERWSLAFQHPNPDIVVKLKIPEFRCDPSVDGLDAPDLHRWGI